VPATTQGFKSTIQFSEETYYLDKKVPLLEGNILKKLCQIVPGLREFAHLMFPVHSKLPDSCSA
jgi:hypothetical protein